jgi:hypothetical protein
VTLATGVVRAYETGRRSGAPPNAIEYFPLYLLLILVPIPILVAVAVAIPLP